jgi:acyl dehydratase
MTRTLSPGVYGWRDLAEGDAWSVGGVTVTEAQIVAFAGVSGDFYDLHMDDEAARARGFPARIAHGLLVLSLVDGLKTRAPVRLDVIASLGWEQRFTAPVFAGDRISGAFRVLGARASKDPSRGVVRLESTVRNQNDDIVQTGVNTTLLR